LFNPALLPLLHANYSTDPTERAVALIPVDHTDPAYPLPSCLVLMKTL
jgi:hypothetical protein